MSRCDVTLRWGAAKVADVDLGVIFELSALTRACYSGKMHALV